MMMMKMKRNTVQQLNLGNHIYSMICGLYNNNNSNMLHESQVDVEPMEPIDRIPPYHFTDDLVYLCCEVSSLTSYRTLRDEWWHKDNQSMDRLVACTIAGLMIILSIVYMTCIVLFIVDSSWLIALSVLHIVESWYLGYVLFHVGKHLGMKSRQ